MEEKQINKEQVKLKIKSIDKFLFDKLLISNELRKEAAKQYITQNHLDWEYNVSQWTEHEKLVVIDSILGGMEYFYTEFSEKKSFPIGNYNNVKSVFEGNDNILFVNKKSIYRFSGYTQMILGKYGRTTVDENSISYEDLI